jgi:hypothetical protein
MQVLFQTLCFALIRRNVEWFLIKSQPTAKGEFYGFRNVPEGSYQESSPPLVEEDEKRSFHHCCWEGE